MFGACLFHVMASTTHLFMAVSLLLSIVQISAWTEKPWDELIYTQQWAPAACLQVSLQKKHQCVIPANVSTWTVHGIWPTEGGSFGPNYCNKTDKFNLSKLSAIHDQLLKYWPNLFTDEPEETFWEHEWTKHGTCAEELPSLNSELKYFSMGLKLNRLYDLQKILQKSGVTPKAEPVYKLSDFQKALSLALGHPPKIQCFLSEDKSHQVLIQIEICFDKSFSVIECKKKRKSNSLLKYTSSEHQRLKRSKGGIPAQTETCLGNRPILYLPFQR